MSESDFERTESEAMSRLMELTDAPQELWKPQELGEILTHQLSMPASVASFGSAQPPHLDRQFTLRQLLNDPVPSLELLQTIRRAAKADCSSPAALLPRDVSLVIYYACIAAGLVRLNKRITDLDDIKLSQAFAWTLNRPWLDAALSQLFEQATATLPKSSSL